jgi:hypothetical protein
MRKSVAVLAVAALGLTADARADVITPKGLAPGSQFRMVFATDVTTLALSPNISFYDSYVISNAGAAGLSMYNGQTVT